MHNKRFEVDQQPLSFCPSHDAFFSCGRKVVAKVCHMQSSAHNGLTFRALSKPFEKRVVKRFWCSSFNMGKSSTFTVCHHSAVSCRTYSGLPPTTMWTLFPSGERIHPKSRTFTFGAKVHRETVLMRTFSCEKKKALNAERILRPEDTQRQNSDVPSGKGIISSV